MQIFIFELIHPTAAGPAAVAAQTEEDARRLLDEAYGGHLEGWRLVDTLKSLPTRSKVLLFDVHTG